ncbi:Peroxisomal membrane protein PEX14 [Hibiscus syriacus]|uniref:Peroxisomal membrane protein PEX14 n=1 Tax=Hibiscus syriacus TaxID=106335 RepID=A0A6A3CBA5_HIBSY|nr:peroxisomal membrane protein PEX14-like isoform X2 [Hibiscus syriacus]KAE8726555.1 Peroxisomal membrane protein PEX14 [Hibiscus syriacus]
MATTQSPSPPNSNDDKPQADSEVVHEANQVQQDVGAEAAKHSVPASVFVNSEPMREDQVSNAVKFLSHPKVRGSPVIYRRSFLERKGLTKEEIDEAFRRVPDPTPSSQPASLNQDGQEKSSSNVQTQAPIQTPQPVAVAPAGIASSVTVARRQFHWNHAVSAVGLLAASGCGTALLIKKVIIPKLKLWVRKVVLEEENDYAKKIDAKPSLVEEAAAAAKAAAAAASDVAKASQEMLNSKNEERRRFEEFMNLMDVQMQEMKSMSNSIRKLEGQANSSGRAFSDHDDHRVSSSSTKQSYANGKVDVNVQPGRSSTPPASAEPPHPKSYMEIMEMIQRGEKPSNIREVNDMPPNPNQQLSNPRIAPRTKPWEAQNGSRHQVLQSQTSAEGLNQNGRDNGLNYLLDDESSTPWWQRKNVRITEIENEDEVKATGPFGVRTNEQPPPLVQRTWVPPQPPPVAMLEAGEAIWRPKSAPKETATQEQSADDQSAAHPSEVTDELQRITKMSESAGAVEMNGGFSTGSSAVKQEQENSYGEN